MLVTIVQWLKVQADAKGFYNQNFKSDVEEKKKYLACFWIFSILLVMEKTYINSAFPCVFSTRKPRDLVYYYLLILYWYER
jgi:hypothetical protein